MTVAPLSPGLEVGDPLPWFYAPLVGKDSQFGIDKMGGKHVLLLLFGSAAQPACAEALRLVEQRRHLLDDQRALFFGVTIDPGDIEFGRVANSMPGIRFFNDTARSISLACRAVDTASGPTGYHPFWLLIDPMLRVIGRFALADGAAAIDALAAAIEQPAEVGAPVLIIPSVLEADFRSTLIALYEADGGAETGFMDTVDGKTVGIIDYQIKRRRDYQIAEENVRAALRQRITRRILPMIKRAYQFNVTRIERYIVACYDGADGGHFRAHRDNTTAGTAHRRFAVTINLNEDYDGGDLRFPEFGMRTYRAPPGGAVVFGCGLLHEATRVTAGRRYATLPFLYDEPAALIREQNWDLLADRKGQYRANAAGERAVSA